MPDVQLMRVERHWICPNCTQVSVTYEVQPHTRYHSCRGLMGLSAPFVLEGTVCKVEAVERQDYLHGAWSVTAEGRPIMAVVTTRDDGQDAAVFAPTATQSVSELELDERAKNALRRRLAAFGGAR